jgi:beta-ureidopropionase / N-carbamoyl-L-amino-acid hydrolase
MTVSVSVSLAEFERLWNQIEPIGRGASGGYRRFAWTPVDLACVVQGLLG